MTTLKSWLLPGHEKRIASTVAEMGKEVPTAIRTQAALTHEIAAKTQSEISSLLELIEDVQDRLGKIEGNNQ